MNKRVKYIVIIVFFASIILGTLGCGNIANLIDGLNNTVDDPKTTNDDDIMPGGWSNSRAPYANELEIFNIAMEGFDDLEYEPFLVTSQTIGGGFNYTFIANSVSTDPNAETATIRVHIFNPAIGSDIKPELTEVWLVEPADNGGFTGIIKLYPISTTNDSGNELNKSDITIRETVSGLETPFLVFSEGLVVVRNGDWELGVIDKTGSFIIPFGMFDEIYQFSYGFAVVFNAIEESVTDTAGNLLVPFGLYIMIQAFSDGLASVRNDDWEQGVIDTTGNMVIPFGLYNEIRPFSEGLAVALNADSEFGVIDKAGNIVIPFGLYDRGISSFNDGLAVVISTNRENPNAPWEQGVIDTAGSKVIPFGLYNGIHQFSDDLAVVWNIDGTGVIDRDGNVIVPLGLYDRIYPFSDGLAVVENDDWEEGVIDTEGNLVIPFGLHNGIDSFSDGVAVVRRNAETGQIVIDAMGSIVVPSGLYSWISPFSDGMAIAENLQDGTWSILEIVS